MNNLHISSGSHLLLLAQTQAERRPAEAHGHDCGGKGRWPEAPRESAEGCRRNRITHPLHECVQHNLQGAEQNDTGNVLWNENLFFSPCSAECRRRDRVTRCWTSVSSTTWKTQCTTIWEQVLEVEWNVSRLKF